MVKNPPANAGDVSLIPGSGRSPGVGKYQPIPVFLPGKFHGQSNLAGYSPRIAKSQTQLCECAHTHTLTIITDVEHLIMCLLTINMSS